MNENRFSTLNPVTLKRNDKLVCYWRLELPSGEVKIVALFKHKTARQCERDLKL